jgi:glutaredoxin 3
MAIIIYASDFCPYCIRAKQLLKRKGLPFEEVSVDGRPDVRAEMAARAGRHTVPQIWIGHQHIGGCDDLYALDARGELDDLLAADQSP